MKDKMLIVYHEQRLIADLLTVAVSKSGIFDTMASLNDDLFQTLEKFEKHGIVCVIFDSSILRSHQKQLVDRISNSRNSNIKWIAVCSQKELTLVNELIDLGLRSIVSTEDSIPDLTAAIDSAFQDKNYFSYHVVNAMISGRTRSEYGSLTTILTPREKEVVKLIAQELTNREIADKICVSEKTVNTHRQNIMAKIDAKNVVGIVNYAHKVGLVE